MKWLLIIFSLFLVSCRDKEPRPVYKYTIYWANTYCKTNEYKEKNAGITFDCLDESNSPNVFLPYLSLKAIKENKQFKGE